MNYQWYLFVMQLLMTASASFTLYGVGTGWSLKVLSKSLCGSMIIPHRLWTFMLVLILIDNFFPSDFYACRCLSEQWATQFISPFSFFPQLERLVKRLSRLTSDKQSHFQIDFSCRKTVFYVFQSQIRWDK